MSVTISAPKISWQGTSAWLGFDSTSSLGDVHTLVGPIPGSHVTGTLAAAASDRLRALVEHACDDAGVVIAQNPFLCSRCVRTILRMALGSQVDARAIANPTKDGDAQRYASASQRLAPHVTRIRASLAELCQEAATGSVQDVADATLQVPPGSKWEALYEKSGAPMHVGQWSDYKLCACGDPTDRTSMPKMLVGAIPSSSGSDKPATSVTTAADAVAAAMGYLAGRT